MGFELTTVHMQEMTEQFAKIDVHQSGGKSSQSDMKTVD
jgi:hypothetical protein